MRQAVLFASALVIGLISSANLGAKSAAKHFAIVNEDVGLPVFPYDLPDRPYIILGTVSIGTGKYLALNSEASQEKIYRKLWNQAEKLGADAVVNARYGDSHLAILSWNKTKASGTAIKFIK